MNDRMVALDSRCRFAATLGPAVLPGWFAKWERRSKGSGLCLGDAFSATRRESCFAEEERAGKEPTSLSAEVASARDEGDLMMPSARTIGVIMILLAGIAQACSGAYETVDRSAAPKPSTSDEQVSHVVTALNSGDAHGALDQLGSRTLEIPVEERWLLEGRAYLLLGDYAEARQKLESAVRARPKETTDLYWLGRVYEADGAPALAAAQYQQAFWSGLASADLHYHWAAALKASGQLLGEISRCKPPEESPGTPKPGDFACGGVVIGLAPARKGRLIVSPPESAIYQVYQSLALQPDRGESLLLCAEIWAAAKKHEEATALFAKAAEKLEKAEDVARCHDGWRASLLALGDFDGYLKHTTERMRAAGAVDSPELASCYAQVAKAVAQRGELQRQIRYLTMSVELDANVDRLVELSDALTSAQRYEEAEQRLRKALERGPTAAQQREIRRRLEEAKLLATPVPKP
jgi:tetratricopeptide (TPR) repeat protein